MLRVISGHPDQEHETVFEDSFPNFVDDVHATVFVLPSHHECLS